MNWTIEPPTKPGAYWFQPEPLSREMLVQVRETNGVLSVWWPKEDQPVATLKAHWRGPIPPSTGPGNSYDILRVKKCGPGDELVDADNPFSVPLSNACYAKHEWVGPLEPPL